MDLLLDTHALLWWLGGDHALSEPAKAAIEDERNGIFVSAASAWEIATKHRIFKFSAAGTVVADLDRAVLDQGFKGLPISLRHGQIAGSLPGPHRDPFDRMLIAQAMTENLILVSNEVLFDSYAVRRLW